MATPLQVTPGDQREDHAQAVGDQVADIYDQVELALIATVAALAHKTATGILTATAARRRLNQTAEVVLDAAVPRIRAVLDTGMAGVRTGVAGTLDPRTALQLDAPDISAVAQSLDQANDAAITSLHAALDTAITAQGASPAPTAGTANVFTPYQDVYRQAVQRGIADTRSGQPGTPLSLSRIQAAQKALDDLGDRGITGFVDKTGRRWNLTSYVEMATRTAVSNAWDDLQAGAMTRAGLDLVQVATHSTEGSCPHCLPWLGQILSLTGATAGHPTLADAKATGFRHPNCRCFWTPVGAGLADYVINPVAVDQAAAVYKASQRQRALEREVRKAGRRAHAAITPQARTAARHDLAKARMASAAHRRITSLRMTKVSVQRREHPHRAH